MRSLPAATPLALVLFLMVTFSVGQLPNLVTLNGVLFPEITVQAQPPSVAAQAAGGLGTTPGDFETRPTEITTDELRDVLRQGFEEASRRRTVGLQEEDLPEAAPIPTRPIAGRPIAGAGAAFFPKTSSRQNTPGFLLYVLRRPKEEVTRDACTGIAVNIAFEIIRDRFPLVVRNTPERIIRNVFDMDLCETLANEFCSTTIVPKEDCNPNSRYRTIDGTCNNLQNTDYGKTNRRMGRLLPPVYEDVVGAGRVRGISGSPLPNPRDVSLALHSSPGQERESEISNFFMQWSQFLDHDIVHIPEVEKRDGVPFDCCGVDRGNPLCFPISTVNPLDTISRVNNRDCIQFARTITAPITSCQYIFREQPSQVTSYIDASQIYGSNEEEEENLRGEDGKLRTFEDSEPPMPTSKCPMSAFAEYPPGIIKSHGFDYETGDSRVTVQPGEVSIHTLFLRVHNRIVDMLTEINPNWDEDRLYQETRRIIGALFQHITYNEFLPILFGPRLMASRHLISTGSYSEYDPSVDAAIINSFGAAAYRFAHSLVGGMLKGEGQTLIMADNYFKGQSVCTRPTRVSALLRGLAASPSNRYDRFLHPDFTNFLFKENEPIGLDQGALDIQRGRDHGLPGYNRWRELCFGQGFSSFDDLRDANVMPPDAVDRISTLYASVDDIDLYSGGLSETGISGGMPGPVFACILAEQFSKLKFGDRFFFEHSGQAGSFPTGQLNAIRDMSMASIMCQFTDTQAIQPQAFFQNSLPGNSPVPCSQLLRLDLSQWKDTPTAPKKTYQYPARNFGSGQLTPGPVASQLEIQRSSLESH